MKKWTAQLDGENQRMRYGERMQDDGLERVWTLSWIKFLCCRCGLRVGPVPSSDIGKS